MNVFILDRDMRKSAKMLDDAHLKAQINEACHILMANWNYARYPDAKIGHVNHPVTVFYGEKQRKTELMDYLGWLLDEYLFRFDKEHQNRFWLDGFNRTPTFPLFEFEVSKTYVHGSMTNDIESIRQYIMTKPHTRPLTWTNREKPDWWEV